MQPNRAHERTPKLDDAPDNVLVALTLSGSKDAFEHIMRRNNRRLFRIARGILGVDADAEDAVQECYLNAYVNLSRFEGRAKLSTWLSRIVVNESLRLVRRRARLETVVRDPANEVRGQGNVVNLYGERAPAPDQQAAERELRNILERAIDGLSENFRVVFLMREVEGMTIHEISDVLDLPEATVKTRNFRARRLLRVGLEEQLEPAVRDAFLFLGERCDRMVAAVLGRIRGVGATEH